MKKTIFLFLFLSLNAQAETHDFTIGVGSQLCTKGDDPTVEYCTATEFQTSREAIELTGNDPWFKNFSKFDARVIIKKRTERFIVRLDVFNNSTGKSLAHYATEVKELKDLNLIKLGSAFIKLDEKSTLRGWLRVQLAN